MDNFHGEYLFRLPERVNGRAMMYVSLDTLRYLLHLPGDWRIANQGFAPDRDALAFVIESKDFPIVPDHKQADDIRTSVHIAYDEQGRKWIRLEHEGPVRAVETLSIESGPVPGDYMRAAKARE